MSIAPPFFPFFNGTHPPAPAIAVLRRHPTALSLARDAFKEQKANCKTTRSADDRHVDEQ